MNDKSKDSLKDLKINHPELLLYKAGIGSGIGFQGNFTRDGIISGILMQDPEILKSQLIFCAQHQGKNRNPFNGEEPGKIFHEYPGMPMNGLSTEYNSCDTTAHFVIGHEIYRKITGDKNLAVSQQEEIKAAVKYIINHIRKDGAFIEDPKFSDAKKFALKVTYWKDSELPDRKNGEPIYPIIYPLAHIQNMRALKSATILLKDRSLEQTVSNMREFMNRELFDEEKGLFYLARDSKGPISAVSSDSLHALFYLDKEDMSKKQLERIVASSIILETPWGYRSLSEKDSIKVEDPYHSKTLWIFEQAIINVGARKFCLNSVGEVSSRTGRYLKIIPNMNPEILFIEGTEMENAGNDPQLWTIAARYYFNNHQTGIFP